MGGKENTSTSTTTPASLLEEPATPEQDLAPPVLVLLPSLYRDLQGSK